MRLLEQPINVHHFLLRRHPAWRSGIDRIPCKLEMYRQLNYGHLMVSGNELARSGVEFTYRGERHIMSTGIVSVEEAVLRAEIDLGRIAAGKYDLDVTGHYARPDVFRLHVNERPQAAAVFSRDGGSDPFSANP